MDAAAFARMKRGALFLNPSRGNLVDEAALLAALDSGQVAGAAMDVGRAPDQMPTPSLAAHPKVVATPHIGGLTPAAIEHQAFDTVRQVTALAAGRLPDHAVNAAAGAAAGAARDHRLSYSAARRGEKAGTSALSSAPICCGHQRSSHSGNMPRSCGITFSAKSRVLYLVSSLPMLPNCSSSIRWPTFSVVATSRSCSATSSGLPMMT